MYWFLDQETSGKILAAGNPMAEKTTVLKKDKAKTPILEMPDIS